MCGWGKYLPPHQILFPSWTGQKADAIQWRQKGESQRGQADKEGKTKATKARV